MSVLDGVLSSILLVIALLCVVTVCLLTCKKGYGVLGILSIFFSLRLAAWSHLAPRRGSRYEVEESLLFSASSNPYVPKPGGAQRRDRKEHRMERQMSGHPNRVRQMGEQVIRWWWLWLVTGALWIIASLILLQFQFVSLVTVDVLIGVLFLIAGIEEVFMASLAQRWKWLGVVFGVLLLIAGIFALVNPIHTFLAVADLLAFLFVLVGIFWTIEAIASRGVNNLWFLGVLAGIVLVILGFWTAGHFVANRISLLLIFVAIWMLCQGVEDLTQAFRFRQMGQQRDTRAVG